MDCLKAREMFFLHLDCELSNEEGARLRQHLEGCSKCSGEWDDWNHVFSSLHLMGEQELVAPPGFAESVMARIKQENSISSPGYWKRWKKAAIGTAAALLLAGGTFMLEYTPITRIADQTSPIEQVPANQPQTSQNLAAQAYNNAQPDAPLTPAAGTEATGTETPKDSEPRKSTTSENPVVLTNSEEHIIVSSFIKIKVADAQTIEQIALSLAQSKGASLQSLGQKSEDGKVCLVYKTVVSTSQAEGLISAFSGLGAVVSKQDQQEDLTGRYSELFTQLLTLEQQRSQEPNGAKVDELDRQMNQIKAQLQSWDKQCQEQTIVLWLQQQ